MFLNNVLSESLDDGAPAYYNSNILDATCEKTMVTLEETLSITHDWAIDRIHTLLDEETDDVLQSLEYAHAIRLEFEEWLDPHTSDHEIYSLEYLSDK